MKSSGFTYFVREGIASTFKNGLMSMASVGVLMACLIIMGTFIIVSENINNIMTDIENKNEIVVFLDYYATEEQVQEMGERLRNMDNVRHVEYTSKDAAFEAYKKSANLEDVLEGMESPISDSYSIFLDDISKMSQTIEKLERMDGIEKVRGREDISDNLITLRNMFSVVALWFFCILIVISIFIISNTIKLAMFARKKEISIMKHVGATDWFIRWPFIVEGIVIGVISAALAFGVQWYIYTYVIEKVFSGINLIRLLPFRAFGFNIGVGFLAVSVFISVIGSMASIRKYLNA